MGMIKVMKWVLAVFYFRYVINSAVNVNEMTLTVSMMFLITVSIYLLDISFQRHLMIRLSLRMIQSHGVVTKHVHIIVL